MIRILHVLGGLERGGAETLVLNLYRKINREEIQFDFIIHTQEKGAYYNEIVSLGGTVYHCPRYKGKNHFEYKKWWRKFFEQHREYKIIHSHIRSSASIFLPIAKKYDLKTIIHSHSTSSGKGISAIVKNILQYPLRHQADYFFGCSKLAGEWLFGKRIVNSDKYYTLNNGIDTDLFKFNPEIRSQYRKQLNLSDKRVYIHVGRFHPSKNHMFLLEIFAEIYKQQPNSVLLLIGKGELQEEIENKISQLNINESVRLLGSRSDVASLLQAADCFLFPSVYEGLPVTVVEAQASGIQCIVSNTITNEVNLTDVIEYLPIDKGTEIWVQKALLSIEEHRNTGNQICNAGFDVRKTAEDIIDFYLKIS